VKRAIFASLVLVALLAPSSAQAFRLKRFHTPDGNIGCAMIFGKESEGGGARCDIDDHSWTAPPKPKWCDVDYGGGLNVGPRRKAEFVCAGDTTLHQGHPLAPGGVETLGPYRCKVVSSRMVRCINRDTGHGFKLSPHLARLF
jgi:uncharacterized protein DUF6636